MTDLFDARGVFGRVDPEPLPALPYVAYPKRLYAEPITYDGMRYLDGVVSDLMHEVEAKLAAEDARLRRLLPPPLPGHEWRAEIAHDVDFTSYSATDTYRLRYRMVEVGS